MGGGLMQLVAYGAQDIYLTGNPQITFFKVVYRRHTNFSMEAIRQTIKGENTTAGGKGNITISRNGDLVHKIYVTSSTAGITDGDSIIDQVELEIGGQLIDRHFKEWHQIWNELTTEESKANGFKIMKGSFGSSGTTGVDLVQIPLQFWFCRNPGLALPLIALQYHEVNLKITWGTSSAVGIEASCDVVADYIFLDTDERRRFAQVSHEYLIEQLQKDTFNGNSSKKLRFNHPIKELIWTNQSNENYTKAKLKLNGHDRFFSQKAEYFQIRQPFDYHTAIPSQNLPICGAPSMITLFSTEEDITDDSIPVNFVVTQPENTVILEVGLIITEGFTTGNGGTHFDVGLEEGVTNRKIVAGDNALSKADGVNYGEIKTGAVVSTGSNVIPRVGVDTLGFRQTEWQSGKFDVILHTNTIRSIYGTIQGTNRSSAGKAKMFMTVARSSNVARTSQLTKKINVYSFSLRPEDHQPSGTCNFSRIDVARLNFTGNAPNDQQNIYAVNYNVLRIMSGMGGLAYSN